MKVDLKPQSSPSFKMAVKVNKNVKHLGENFVYNLKETINNENLQRFYKNNDVYFHKIKSPEGHDALECVITPLSPGGKNNFVTRFINSIKGKDSKAYTGDSIRVKGMTENLIDEYKRKQRTPSFFLKKAMGELKAAVASANA